MISLSQFFQLCFHQFLPHGKFTSKYQEEVYELYPDVLKKISKDINDSKED